MDNKQVEYGKFNKVFSSNVPMKRAIRKNMREKNPKKIRYIEPLLVGLFAIVIVGAFFVFFIMGVLNGVAEDVGVFLLIGISVMVANVIGLGAGFILFGIVVYYRNVLEEEAGIRIMENIIIDNDSIILNYNLKRYRDGLKTNYYGRGERVKFPDIQRIVVDQYYRRVFLYSRKVTELQYATMGRREVAKEFISNTNRDYIFFYFYFENTEELMNLIGEFSGVPFEYVNSERSLYTKKVYR